MWGWRPFDEEPRTVSVSLRAFGYNLGNSVRLRSTCSSPITLDGLDPRLLDDAIRALDLDFDEFCKGGWVFGNGLCPERGEAVDHLWLLRGSLHGGVDMLDGVGREPLGTPKAVPEHEIEARDPELGGRGDRRQTGTSLPPHDRKGPHAAVLHIR